MKKLFLVILAILFLITGAVGPAMAKDVTLQFEWSYNTEPDMKRYVMFHTVEGQVYNYAIPVKLVPCTMQNGACAYDPIDAQVTFNVPDGSVTNNKFVIRAEDAEGNQSGDSSEVTATVDVQTLFAATMLQGVYNDVTKTIDFTWSHADESRVDRWDLFNASISGGPYTKVGEFSSMTGTWPVPGDGTYYFTVVGFVAGGSVIDPTGSHADITYDTYSPDSNEAQAVVRVHPASTKNFKVKVWIR